MFYTIFSPSQQRDFCVFLMNQFLRRHLMRGLLLENVETTSNNQDRSNLIENELLQRVTNLPDKFSAFLLNSDRHERKKYFHFQFNRLYLVKYITKINIIV